MPKKKKIFDKLENYILNKYKKESSAEKDFLRSNIGPKKTILEDGEFKIEGSKPIKDQQFESGKRNIEAQIDEQILKGAEEKATMHQDDDEQFKKFMRRVKALRELKKK